MAERLEGRDKAARAHVERLTPVPLAKALLAKATVFVHTDSQLEERARTFHAAGIKPADAFHLASAVEAKADYFCTCDDRFLKRAKTINTEHTKMVSPLELIVEVIQ